MWAASRLAVILPLRFASLFCRFVLSVAACLFVSPLRLVRRCFVSRRFVRLAVRRLAVRRRFVRKPALRSYAGAPVLRFVSLALFRLAGFVLRTAR